MIKELKIKKVKTNLEERILNAINDYIEQQEKENTGVPYCEIIGTLEYVKAEIMSESYESIS